MHILKLAFRQLLVRPGLTATVTVVLALGIGATTAMFSLFHQLLLEPVAGVAEPGRLVNLGAPGPKPGGARPGIAVGDYQAVFSYPMFRDLQTEQTVFTGLAANYDFLANVAYRERSTGGRGALVSGSYFGVLGLSPALGRLIGPQDEPAVGASPVVVLAFDYWENELGGDPGVIGKTLSVNNQALEIVGVAPEDFEGTMQGWRPDVYVPLTLRWLMQPEEPRNDDNRLSYWLYLFGRLKPGVDVEQATASLNAYYSAVTRDVEAPLLSGLTQAQMRQFLDRRLTVEPGARGQTGFRPGGIDPLTLLLAATAVVLMIACVNVANLLLARGAARSSEMAIRASIGASRGRLLVQLVAESLALGLLGGLASLPVAVLTLRLVAAIVPAATANRFAPALDAPAALFAASLTIGTVLVFGLVPALRTSRTDPGEVIKTQTARSSGGRAAARLRSSLVGAQIGLSVVLLVLAGLFLSSLANVARIDLGMDVDSLVGFSVSPLLSGYQAGRLDVLYDEITTELAAQPGIDSVASTAIPLLNNLALFAGVSVAGAEDSGGGNFGAQVNFMTSPDLFATLSIPLLAGRDFTSADSVGEPAVAIVNETFVQRFDLGTNPVGRLVRFANPYLPSRDIEIVGVVGDAHYANVKSDVPPQAFTPRPRGDDTFSSLFFYVRGGIDADSIVRMIPEVVERIDPTLPVGNLTTMRRQARSTVATDRLITILSTSFAGLATLLAAVGLYGVLSFSVTERTRELGLRLALGAQPAKLRTLVLGQIGSVALIGGGLGLVAAVALGRVAESMLFGVSGFDPLVLGAAVAVIAIVVVAASYLPARRAASIAPMAALRYE